MIHIEKSLTPLTFILYIPVHNRPNLVSLINSSGVKIAAVFGKMEAIATYKSLLLISAYRPLTIRYVLLSWLKNSILTYISYSSQNRPLLLLN